MFIGSAARKTGLSIKAIRFYEREGLIPTPARAGRYRRYDDTTVELLLLIKEARALGLSIAGLKELIQWVDGQMNWQRVVDFLEQQKARIRDEIRALEDQLARIDSCIAEMETCPTLQEPSRLRRKS